MDTDIDDAVRSSLAWRDNEDLLSKSARHRVGISRTLIAELAELGTLDRKQIAALAGLAPFTRQCGGWRGKSRIGGGRTAVRTALFMGAMVAKQHNPVLKALPPASLLNNARRRACVPSCDPTTKNGTEMDQSSSVTLHLRPVLPASHRTRRSQATDVWRPEWTFAQLEHAPLLHAFASILHRGLLTTWHCGNVVQRVLVPHPAKLTGFCAEHYHRPDAFNR